MIWISQFYIPKWLDSLEFESEQLHLRNSVVTAFRFSKPYLTSFLLIMTGIAGTVAACVWGAIAYKNRGPAMTTSRYLMRLRVIAQSCVVGSIMAGIGVTALQNKIEARSKKDQL